ncbi:MAG: tRNA adenosine(34) deaminase TadA [Methylococcales bacterium]|nr:tRNA adenosine(34) deaminase TadA [Methylococcales bacterium]
MTSQNLIDEAWMRHAMRLAERAQQQGEVPVGAVVVQEDRCLGEGWNQPISRHDPSAHAEIVALRAAAQVLHNYRLPGVTLYVTLEPCLMCLGALIQARVRKVVFAAPDSRRGALGGAVDLAELPFLNHHLEWRGGVLEQPAAALLRTFFQARRKSLSPPG